MKKDILKHTKVIVLLHEIYGVNAFMISMTQVFKDAGFDVVCPDYIGRVFAYEDSALAYQSFTEDVGFSVYHDIDKLIAHLKQEYEQVLLIGFSIGATIAWRCSENPDCDGVIACYGSRIRDYMQVVPQCPVCLLFAEKDSFPVSEIADRLRAKHSVQIHIYAAEHGFLDSFSPNYDAEQAVYAFHDIQAFLTPPNPVLKK